MEMIYDLCEPRGYLLKVSVCTGIELSARSLTTVAPKNNNSKSNINSHNDQNVNYKSKTE